MEFDMKNFEENCFGKSDSHSSGDIWSPNTNSGSNTRSAYILVYSKKKKGNLKFKFDEKNIADKEKVIEQFLKRDDLDQTL